MLCLLFSFLLTPVQALDLPQGLSDAEQVQLLRTLGLATGTKFLSQAYPMGGHSGFEVGLSSEVIPMDALQNMGDSEQSPTPTLVYPTISIAKGLYNDTEFHFHFSPRTQASGISRYGLSGRWSFYNMEEIPLNFVLIGHANSSQLADQLVTRNVGLDLMAGYTLGRFSVFALFGSGTSSGRFLGGAEGGLTRSTEDQSQSVSSLHSALGLTYHFRPIFLSASVDRYHINSYNLKLGLFF